MNSPCYDASCGTVSLGRPAFGGLFQRLLAVPAAVAQTLMVWQDRAQQRRHLASLDDRLLRDMGLSRADVEREARQPFWRVN